MITLENITRNELIGLNTKVVNSSNPQNIGMNGTVVDETKSMFILKTNKGFKTLSKYSNVWTFFVNEQKITISGSSLCKRPQDRLKGKL